MVSTHGSVVPLAMFIRFVKIHKLQSERAGITLQAQSTQRCLLGPSWSQSRFWWRRGKSQKLSRSRKSRPKSPQNQMCISERNKVMGEQKYNFMHVHCPILHINSILSRRRIKWNILKNTTRVQLVGQLLDIDNLRTFCRYVFQDGSLKSGLQLTIRLLLIYL